MHTHTHTLSGDALEILVFGCWHVPELGEVRGWAWRGRTEGRGAGSGDGGEVVWGRGGGWRAGWGGEVGGVGGGGG